MECLTSSCLKRYAALGFLDLFFYGVRVNLTDRSKECYLMVYDISREISEISLVDSTTISA